MRPGYDHGPHLAWWWLDGYVDFDREQKEHAKQAIGEWFDWHRSAQLLEYADWLSTVRNRIKGPLTPGQVCQWSDEVRDIVEPALDHAVLLAAPVVLSLGEAQWRHLEQRYGKSNDKLRRKYLQPDAEDRLNASVKRTVKRFKQLYGRLDDKQRSLITASIEGSPFDPEKWLFERRRRQLITLATLKQLSSEFMPAEHAANQLRELIRHTFRSDEHDYQVYQEELAAYTCTTIAHMHNSTTPVQRHHAHDKLKNWEADLRALAGDSRRTGNKLQIVSE